MNNIRGEILLPTQRNGTNNTESEELLTWFSF